MLSFTRLALASAVCLMIGASAQAATLTKTFAFSLNGFVPDPLTGHFDQAERAGSKDFRPGPIPSHRIA
jgi:hypothetical protein